MAHSIQNIGDKAAIINDSDLLILVGIMLDEINDAGSSYNALSSFSERWDKARKLSGPGTLVLELDLVAANPKAKLELDNLFSSVEQKLNDWGEVISAATANEKWRIQGVTFADCPTSRVVSAISKLRELFENEVQDCPPPA